MTRYPLASRKPCGRRSRIEKMQYAGTKKIKLLRREKIWVGKRKAAPSSVIVQGVQRVLKPQAGTMGVRNVVKPAVKWCNTEYINYDHIRYDNL
jgi:hypothetical protein